MAKLPPPSDLLFLPLKVYPKEFEVPLWSDPVDKELALAGEGFVIKLFVAVGIGGRLLLDIVLALLLDET